MVAPKASKGKQNYLPDPFAILSISRTQRKTKFDTVSWDKSTLTSALRDLSTGNEVVPFQLGDNVYKLLVYHTLGSCGAPYSESFLSNETLEQDYKV